MRVHKGVLTHPDSLLWSLKYTFKGCASSSTPETSKAVEPAAAADSNCHRGFRFSCCGDLAIVGLFVSSSPLLVL
jgi:hypothetical protein